MSKDYKSTLLMPKTSFPMRGNLGVRELDIEKKWNEIDLYNEVLKKNEGKPVFNLHDGPPYANGNLHTGHALNKTLKDIIVRYKNLSGFKAQFIPGWDTHGLPIESAVTKKGINRKKMSVSEFRQKCHEYALKQVENQKEQFIRMGILADFENPYLTLHKDYEAEQIRIFSSMVEKKLIFKGLKPVYWSPTSESALAEAEIEYHDKRSPSIFVAFKIVKTNDQIEEGSELVIWTTTPWTLPANLAIAVGENIEYSLVSVNDRKLLISSNLVKSVMEELEYNDFEVVKTYLGSDLEGVVYRHPIYDRESNVVIGHHVSEDGGTGLVHIAPGHGEDDFIIGKKYNLEILCPVNGSGVMTEEAGFVSGLFYEAANKEIGLKLEEVGALLKLKFIKHSYPHDWRTKKPIIFRATPQWFASIETLKPRMLEVIKDVKWLPNWGENRIHNMIEGRESWCISRQRSWGVPIPVFYNEDGSEILDIKVIEHVANLFEEHGSNIWFDKEAKDLLPEGYTNPLSPNGLFTKESDIMDVWFDSGSSHHSVMKNRNLPYPADLYLEGNDQYRGWFNSSLSTGVAATNEAPYKMVITHGFVLDKDGRKMSKSLGNIIDPQKIIKQIGADILRLWVASVDYQSDVRISQDMIKQVSESYRKIRNSFRFILGNLSDYDNELNKVSYNDLLEADKYMFITIENLSKKIINSYENYEFADVLRAVNNFITNELSSFYLDFTKDVLYIEKEDSLKRRSIQTVFYKIIDTLNLLLAPILPHTTDEVYSHLPNKDKESIMLEDIEIKPELLNLDVEKESILNKYNEFMKFRSIVLKELEKAREDKIIGKSLNAKLEITADSEVFDLLSSLDIDLKLVFIVSECNLVKGDTLNIEVSKKEGHTCERCWLIVDEVEDGICKRCSEVIK